METAPVHARRRAVLAATADGAHGATQRNNRLAEIRVLFAEDVAAVDREIERLVHDGVSPAVEAAAHLCEAGGKRVRPLTVILSAACFGPPNRTARDVAAAAELVHLATLLHDDVIDDGAERRGRVTSRRIWGNAMSVLAGDHLLTHALELVAARAPVSVLGALLTTLRRLVDGEIVQLDSRTKIEVSEETYFRVARDKTASLFEWAARSGAVCADATPEAASALGNFGAHVGLAFQLVDDVLDYTGDPAAAGKSLFVDLLEGKLTLPLIRTVTAMPSLLRDIESVRSGDKRSVLRIAEAVRSSGTCDEVRALAREETRRAAASLSAVPPSDARSILETIAHELAARVA